MSFPASNTLISRSPYAAKRHRSPGALAAAIAINGGVLALFLTLNAGGFVVPPDDTLLTRNIPTDPVPPPLDADPIEKPKPTQKAMPRPVPDDRPFVRPPLGPELGTNLLEGRTDPGPIDLGGIGPTLPLDPPHVVKFVGATPDPRYADAFHPIYPPALQRAGLEGSVTVRVTIDESGRVIAVVLVRADSRAFFEETREQALSHWRFRPATRDGEPVRSEQTLTVHFRLDA